MENKNVNSEDSAKGSTVVKRIEKSFKVKKQKIGHKGYSLHPSQDKLLEQCL